MAILVVHSMIIDTLISLLLQNEKSNQHIKKNLRQGFLNRHFLISFASELLPITGANKRCT